MKFSDIANHMWCVVDRPFYGNCGKLYWLPRNLHVHYMDEWISLMLRLLFFVSPLGP